MVGKNWWWEKWEVKQEARLLAQATVRMEFLLIGMEEAGGEAVLGRRWEFGLGLARCVFPSNAGSTRPSPRGRGMAEHFLGLEGFCRGP